MTAGRAKRSVAVSTIAAVTLRRLVRGRALWVAAAIAMLPVPFAWVRAARDSSRSLETDVFAFVLLVLAVLPGLLVAASIGEEIEERTSTYLWSRPVPRWALPAGKLLATLPVIHVLALGSWCAASAVALGELPSLASCGALVLAATALGLVAATIGVLAPRYAMALTICYMLFLDLPLGGMPAAIENLSITRHARGIAGLIPDETASTSVIGLAILAALWAAVGLRQIRRLEA